MLSPGVTTGPPCQQQNANNFETMAVASYQHIFSPKVIGDFRAMVRNNGNDFYSNALSTPIILFQHNWFNEAYFKGMVTIDHGRHEWKLGVESDNTFLNENFNYIITDPSQFDDNTALTFSFPGAYPSQGKRPDLEQSAFVQDLIRLGNWTHEPRPALGPLSTRGQQHAVEPRVAISRYFPGLGLIAHFSYDRVFQTPSFENILLSSSFEVAIHQSRCPALAGHAFPRQLLRSGGVQGVRQQPAGRRQLLLAQCRTTTPMTTRSRTPPSAFPLRSGSPSSTARKAKIDSTELA